MKIVFFEKILYNKFEGDSMNFSTLLKKEAILITPYEEKMRILEDRKIAFLNIKFLTIEEFIEKMAFSYSEEAFVYLIQKYDFSCEVAETMLKNMIYIDEVFNFHDMYSYKKELIEKNLLKQNHSFLKYIQGKTVFVYGYENINKYQEKILKKVGATFLKQGQKKYIPSIYEFSSIEEEVDFVANKIVDLLFQGIPMEKIKIGPIFSEYEMVLPRIFSWYNLPLKRKRGNLYGTSPALFFLENISLGVESALKKIEENFNLQENRLESIYSQILEIANRYAFCEDLSTIKKIFTYEFKKTPLKDLNKHIVIESISLDKQTIEEDEYVFVFGCNRGNIPSIEKDDDYLSDRMKEKIGLDTSIQKNKRQKEFFRKKIHSIKNIVVTYKKKTAFLEYVQSPILEGLSVKLSDKQYSHSHLANRLSLSIYLDNKRKYGVETEDLKQLQRSYKMEDYLSYQNNFTGIIKEDLHQFLKNKWTVSYSSIDTYYRCEFRYYLSYILKLNLKEETFAMQIGNIFHYVLSEVFSSKQKSSFYVEKYLKEHGISLNAKELFFMKKLMKELDFIIETIDHQNQFIGFKRTSYEKRISIPISNKVDFVGVIDKLFYDNIDGTNHVAIIDYKTGNPDIDLNRTIHGINMQLPLYMYLAKELEEKVEIVGIYLQKILLKEVTRDFTKTLEEQKKEQLKLCGYSISDETVLEKFDNSYVDSNVIRGMKKSKKGFYAYSKVLKKSQMETLSSLAKEKILKASSRIENGHFAINPKKIGLTDIGCEFCSFKDICYQKEKDKILLKEFKNLEFLGGELYANVDEGTTTGN